MTTLGDIASAREALRLELRERKLAGEIGDVNWTYDAQGKHVPATDRAGAIVFGFNAGGGGGGSEVRWRNKCKRLTIGFAESFLLAELILLSSHDIDALRQSYPDLPSLIARCAPVNQAVIAYHQPTLILQTGFTCLDAVASVYDLTPVNPFLCQRPTHPTHVLLKHYRMKDGTPWLAIRHPSSRGFSNSDVDAIRNYISEFCGVPTSN